MTPTLRLFGLQMVLFPEYRPSCWCVACASHGRKAAFCNPTVAALVTGWAVTLGAGCCPPTPPHTCGLLTKGLPNMPLPRADGRRPSSHRRGQNLPAARDASEMLIKSNWFCSHSKV